MVNKNKWTCGHILHSKNMHKGVWCLKLIFRQNYEFSNAAIFMRGSSFFAQGLSFTNGFQFTSVWSEKSFPEVYFFLLFFSSSFLLDQSVNRKQTYILWFHQCGWNTIQFSFGVWQTNQIYQPQGYCWVRNEALSRTDKIHPK